MAANDVGDVKESAMHQPLLSPDALLVTVWAGVSSASRTALHCPNDIIHPVIVPLHEQSLAHRQ